MLRTSCSVLIKQLFGAGKITRERREESLNFIMSAENHKKIRNLVAMILLPKKLHKNDQSQTAFLRAAVSRVSFFCAVFFLILGPYYGLFGIPHLSVFDPQSNKILDEVLSH